MLQLLRKSGESLKTLNTSPAKTIFFFKIKNILKFAIRLYVISEVLEKFGDNLLALFCKNIANKNSMPFDLENKVQGQ